VFFKEVVFLPFFTVFPWNLQMVADFSQTLSILIEKTERHAAQAPALRERYHKSSIFNSGSSGLGFQNTSQSKEVVWIAKTIQP
jgi:hypothetical protein